MSPSNSDYGNFETSSDEEEEEEEEEGARKLAWDRRIRTVLLQKTYTCRFFVKEIDQRNEINLNRDSLTNELNERLMTRRRKNNEKEEEEENSATTTKYLGYEVCGSLCDRFVGACTKCFDGTIKILLNKQELQEFEFVTLFAERDCVDAYVREVAKITRERESRKEERKKKRVIERMRRVEEEREREQARALAQQRREEEDREREQARALAQRLEKAEIFSNASREFTNSEVLEIVNMTDEGKRILEREKVRLQEGIESVEKNLEDHTVCVRVQRFTNLKNAEEMKGASVSVSIVNAIGEILEQKECTEIVGTCDRNGDYVVNGAECSFVLPSLTSLEYLSSHEKFAFIFELKHIKLVQKRKDSYKRHSIKCWTYMEVLPFLRKLKEKEQMRPKVTAATKLVLPLAAKPTDTTRKRWVSYETSSARGLISLAAGKPINFADLIVTFQVL